MWRREPMGESRHFWRPTWRSRRTLAGRSVSVRSVGGQESGIPEFGVLGMVWGEGHGFEARLTRMLHSWPQVVLKTPNIRSHKWGRFKPKPDYSQEWRGGHGAIKKWCYYVQGMPLKLCLQTKCAREWVRERIISNKAIWSLLWSSESYRSML